MDSHGARTLAEQIPTGKMSVAAAAECSDAFINDGASKAATHVPCILHSVSSGPWIAIMCLLRYRFFCMYPPSPAGEFATNAEVHPILFQMDEASYHNFSFKGAFAFGCQAI